MDFLSPKDTLGWARRQLELDRARLQGKPHLWAHKVVRMRASPFAFLRGAAPLFYEMLAQHPELAAGPAGEGWIAGDLHLENFGCYRVDPTPEASSRVVFDLNDLDDAAVAPWRWDVLRVSTSLLLAARGLGVSGPEALDLCGALLEGYRQGQRRSARASEAVVPPRPVAALLTQAERLTTAKLLAGRTQGVGHHRRFVRGSRYRDVPASLARTATAAFSRYVEAKRRSNPYVRDAAKDAFDVLDVASRVAGTGSLGVLRLAILVRGKGGARGAWMFDMKEEGSPAPAVLVNAPRESGAERVLSALACLPHPPQLAGATQLGRKSLLVRRLTPQEERLDLGAVHPKEWPKLAAYLGGLVARFHRAGTPRKGSAWSAADAKEIVDRAATLAGLHEAAYLGYCRLTEHDVKA